MRASASIYSKIRALLSSLTIPFLPDRWHNAFACQSI